MESGMWGVFRNWRNYVVLLPIFAYASYFKPLKLYTDACGLGIGAVVYQQQSDGTDRAIAYSSYTHSKSKRNYPAHRLEFIVLKWAMIDHFHEYLYGGTFDVYTDNNSTGLSP